MKTKHCMLLFIFSLLLLAVGCSPAEPVATEEEEQEYPVLVEEIKEGALERYVTFTGRAEANTIVHIMPKVSGEIRSIAVKEGDKVSAGQTLLTLDTKAFEQAVKQAEAGLASAQAALEQAKSNQTSAITQAENSVLIAEQAVEDAEREFNRIKSLYEAGAVPQQQLDQAQTAYTNAQLQLKNALDALENSKKTEGIAVAEQSVEQARVNLEIARSNLADTKVTAPQAGVVVELNAEVGEMASPGQAVMKLMDVNPMMVITNVPENQLAYFSLGQEVKLTFDSINLKTVGVVDYISPLNSATNGGYPVKIRVANDDEAIKHGMVAQIELDQLKSDQRGLIVPTNAILKIDGKDIIYIVEQNRAVLKEVTVLEQTSATSLIEADVQPGAQVIVRGHTLLSDGAPVRIVEE